MVNGRKWWRSVRRRPHELLQDADMEHVVHSSTWWQLQADGDVVNHFGDAIGPEVAGLELARRGLRQGGSRALPEAKQGPISYLVCDGAVELVVVVLLDLLCLFKAVADVLEEGIPLLHVLGHGGDPGFALLIGPNGGGGGSRP